MDCITYAAPDTHHHLLNSFRAVVIEERGVDSLGLDNYRPVAIKRRAELRPGVKRTFVAASAPPTTTSICMNHAHAPLGSSDTAMDS